MTNKLVKNNTKLNQKRGGGVRSPQTTFKFALGGVANPETEKRLTMVQSIFTHVASINENLLEQKKNGYIRTCLEYLHGRRFIVLEHQYGRRDVL